MVYPQPLNKSDKIAVVAPASFIPNIENFRRGISIIEKKGYKVVYEEGITGRSGLFSADDMKRASELEGYFKDPTVKAIICARAGFGSVRTLRHLDLSVIKDNPKFFYRVQ